MTHPLPLSLRQLFLIPLLALLAACQSVPPPAKGFSPEQVAALQAEGFVETGDDWTLTINERLLFPSNESGLKSEQIGRLGELARHLVAVGIPTARIEGHTDSTGAAAYNQALSEARAQSVAMLRLSLRAIGFDDGFGPLTHKRAAESLFFSLCCSKRNAVQVDSRPH